MKVEAISNDGISHNLNNVWIPRDEFEIFILKSNFISKYVINVW
jgi:hypothetical protein